MNNERTTMLPLNLEVGMRVKAICMTKLVGDYVVLKLGVYDNLPAAWLGVWGDEESRRGAEEIVVGRAINPSTGGVHILKGKKIQATDYYCDERIRFTPDPITELGAGEVFVFGSNLAGHHAGGAAATARERWGAREGVGEGWTSECTYAVPTLDADMKRVTFGSLVESFSKLIDAVKANTDRVFYLTRVGVGIAGWSVEDVADALWLAVGEGFRAPDNLIIPRDFYYNEILEREVLIQAAREAKTPEERERIHWQIADVENCLTAVWSYLRGRE